MLSTAPSTRPAAHLLTAPSVFRRQTLVVAALLPIVVVGLITSESPVSPLAWVAFGALIAITVATALPAAATLPPRLLALPLLADLPTIALLGAESPSPAPWVILIIPVAWIARSYGSRDAVISVLTTTLCLSAASGWAVGRHDASIDVVLGMSVATLVVAVAMAAVGADARTTQLAQADLLQRQAGMLEEALAQARTRRRATQEVLDTVDFAILTITPGRRVPDLNVTARRLLERLQIQPTTPTDRLPLYAIDGTTPLDPRAYGRLVAGEVEELPLWLGHPGSPRVALSLSANTVQVPGRGLARVVLAARDITEERAAITARDDMIASLSHELRTPLSSIIGYVELVLEDPELSASHRSSLDVALKNSDRVLRLVTDLSQVRADAAATPGFTVTMTDCDMAKVLAESLDSIRPLAADRMLSVSVDAPPSLQIDGDPFRMRNVVDNLLSNAVKYNELGGWIDITLAEDSGEEGGAGGEVVLAISNTGSTLQPDEVARLFDRFYRAPSSRQSTVHGTGIGLSVVKEIVELHGGTITAESSPDAGTTTFIVRLPLRSHEPADDSTTTAGEDD